jgi:hypothetical protein
MEGFYSPEIHVGAAHTLALADERECARDRAGLIALGRQVLAQAESLALTDPDLILAEAHWDAVESLSAYENPERAIAEVLIDRATVDHVVERLDDTTGPSTPGDAEDAARDFVLILGSVLHALHLVVDIDISEAVRELSENRMSGELPPPVTFTGEASFDSDQPF